MNRNSFITHVESAYLDTPLKKKCLPTIIKKLDEKDIPQRYVRIQNIIDQKFHNNKRLHITEMRPYFEEMKEITRHIHDTVLHIVKISSTPQKQEDFPSRALQKIS